MILKRTTTIAGGAAFALAAAMTVAQADRIKHSTAVFSGLDKITGRIIAFEVATDETVQFGSLQVTPKICYTRPATEAPQTTTFVEVDEIGVDTKDYKRIFSGWMYASSPGLHGVEHPVYDIWLTDCKGGTEVIKTPVEQQESVDAETPLREPKPGTTPRPRRAQTDQPPTGGFASPALPPPVPAQPRQPTQRFFPTNNAPAARPDPTTGGGNR